jgi:hypothetical protein
MVHLQIAEFTGRYRQILRRYRSGSENSCPVYGYHNASVEIDETTDRNNESGDDRWPHDDPRWPKICACNAYLFLESDHWQNNYVRIFRMPDGSEFQFWGAFGRCAPVGAMVRAEWFDDFKDVPGDSWLISLPDGGEWITTQKASGGGYWTVEGTPPDITVSPSIFHNQPSGWHGFIRGGELVNA